MKKQELLVAIAFLFCFSIVSAIPDYSITSAQLWRIDVSPPILVSDKTINGGNSIVDVPIGAVLEARASVRNTGTGPMSGGLLGFNSGNTGNCRTISGIVLLPGEEKSFTSSCDRIHEHAMPGKRSYLTTFASFYSDPDGDRAELSINIVNPLTNWDKVISTCIVPKKGTALTVGDTVDFSCTVKNQGPGEAECVKFKAYSFNIHTKGAFKPERVEIDFSSFSLGPAGSANDSKTFSGSLPVLMPGNYYIEVSHRVFHNADCSGQGWDNTYFTSASPGSIGRVSGPDATIRTFYANSLYGKPGTETEFSLLIDTTKSSMDFTTDFPLLIDLYYVGNKGKILYSTEHSFTVPKGKATTSLTIKEKMSSRMFGTTLVKAVAKYDLKKYSNPTLDNLIINNLGIMYLGAMDYKNLKISSQKLITANNLAELPITITRSATKTITMNLNNMETVGTVFSLSSDYSNVSFSETNPSLPAATSVGFGTKNVTATFKAPDTPGTYEYYIYFNPKSVSFAPLQSSLDFVTILANVIPKTCIQEGGKVCAINQVCSNSFVPASDTTKCCKSGCQSSVKQFSFIVDTNKYSPDGKADLNFVIEADHNKLIDQVSRSGNIVYITLFSKKSDSFCNPGDTKFCGPANEIGACKRGVQVCGTDNLWSECLGAVPAAPEFCGNGLDDDCDGVVDNGCADESCVIDTTRSCGPQNERGICKKGAQTCQSDQKWGSCVGAVSPTGEICGDGLDNDCDGLIDGKSCITSEEFKKQEEMKHDNGLNCSNWDQRVAGVADPTIKDVDADDLDNCAEIEYKTNPNNPDTDGDGVSDGQEVLYDQTDPLNPKSNALKTELSKIIATGATQKIKVVHPPVDTNVLEKCKSCVSGILKGTSANIIDNLTGKGKDYTSNSVGIIEFKSNKEAEFLAIVYNGKYSSSTKFRSVNSIVVVMGLAVDLGKSLFGETSVDYPVLLFLLVLLCLVAAILSFKRTEPLFGSEIVPTSAKKMQLSIRLAVAIIFAVLPLALNRFLGFSFGYGAVMVELFAIFIAFYWERTKRRLEKIKLIKVD